MVMAVARAITKYYYFIHSYLGAIADIHLINIKFNALRLSSQMVGWKYEEIMGTNWLKGKYLPCCTRDVIERDLFEQFFNLFLQSTEIEMATRLSRLPWKYGTFFYSCTIPNVGILLIATHNIHLYTHAFIFPSISATNSFIYLFFRK